jgi:hypothetical protein
MDWVNKEHWDAEKEFCLEKDWEWYLLMFGKTKEECSLEDFKNRRVDILKPALEYKYKINFNINQE